jgi:hypothetical protein
MKPALQIFSRMRQHAAQRLSPLSLKNDFVILMCPYAAIGRNHEGKGAINITIKVKMERP